MDFVIMGVNMKTIIFIFSLFSHILSAQVFDTAYVAPRNALAIKGDKIVSISLPRNANESISVRFFDGKNWNNISKNFEPTLQDRISECTFSNHSDNLFVTGLYHLWEYDGQNWIKHAIYDSLYNKRIFEEIIALPDSSLLVTAYSRLLNGEVWKGQAVDSIKHELLIFKNGVFTTIKSLWTNPKKGGQYRNAFEWLKSHKNYGYSMLTNIESENYKTTEIVLYNLEGILIRKDTFPDLSLYGFNDSAISFNDYLFDSKEHLWLLTYSPRSFYIDSSNKLVNTTKFIGLIEIDTNGILTLYNENIGIGNSYYDSQSFTLDENDNIWFFYNYRWFPMFPSLYKLDSSRKKLTEYSYETYLRYSKIYSGSKNVTFGGTTYGLILFNNFTNSLFVTRNGTNMLEFFVSLIPTSTIDRTILPISVFPNPVLNDNFVIIKDINSIINNEVFLILSDISGAIIRKEIVNSVDNQISISTFGLPRGSYYVTVLNNNNVILQTAFIKE